MAKDEAAPSSKPKFRERCQTVLDGVVLMIQQQVIKSTPEIVASLASIRAYLGKETRLGRMQAWFGAWKALQVLEGQLRDQQAFER